MTRELATTLYWIATNRWTAAGVGNVRSFNVQHHVVNSGRLFTACWQIGRTMEEIGDVATLSYIEKYKGQHITVGVRLKVHQASENETCYQNCHSIEQEAMTIQQ